MCLIQFKMIGEKLKKLRTAKGLSQTELGKKAKISYVQIGRYENNVNMPSSKVLKKIADALEVDTDHFFDSEEETAIDFKEVNRNYEKLTGMLEENSEDLNFMNKFFEVLILKQEVRKLV